MRVQLGCVQRSVTASFSAVTPHIICGNTAHYFLLLYLHREMDLVRIRFGAQRDVCMLLATLSDVTFYTRFCGQILMWGVSLGKLIFFRSNL